MTAAAQTIPFPEGYRDGPFVISPTGLQVIGRPDFSAWEQIGGRIKAYYRGIHWVIGDWLLYGERTFGQEAYQALDETGFAIGTLRNDRWVCSRIEPERRRQKLSFDHHMLIADLDPSGQEEMLDLALAQGLNRDRFRRVVRDYKQAQRRQQAPGRVPYIMPAREGNSEGGPEAGDMGVSDFLVGHFAQVLARVPAGAFQLALCQPPADEDAFAQLPELARRLEQSLCRGGSFLCQVPTWAIDRLIPEMGRYLVYHWLLVARSPAGYLEGKGVSAQYRPWVWLVNGYRRSGPTVCDLVDGDPATYFAQQLSVEGEAVLDPWCGDGRLLEGPARAGRCVVGIDPLAHNIDLARQRLGMTTRQDEEVR